MKPEPKSPVSVPPPGVLRPVSPIRPMEETVPAPRAAPWLRSLLQGRWTPIVLSVVGACLLVTGIGRYYDQWKTAQGMRRELLERYLLYMNLTWDEYNLAYPLVGAPLTYERYARVLTDLSAARSKRLESFARLQTLALSLRAYRGEGSRELESALYQSDTRASELSGMVDGWLRDSYCMRNDCLSSRGNFRDLKYPQYEELMKIRERLLQSHAEDWKVVELLERQIEGK